MGKKWAMIDSGASASVCGMDWYAEWLKGKEPHDVKASEKVFRFGDGDRIRSVGYVEITYISTVDEFQGTAVHLRIDLAPGKCHCYYRISFYRDMDAYLIFR